MKGLVIGTDGKISVRDFAEPLHRSLGEAVGGYIEVVHPLGLSSPFLMIVNEEGQLKDLPLNIVASYLYGQSIVGSAIIMKEGIVHGEPDVVGLSNANVSYMQRILRLLKGLWRRPPTGREPGTCRGYIGPKCTEICAHEVADCDSCEYNRGCVDCINPVCCWPDCDGGAYDQAQA